MADPRDSDGGLQVALGFGLGLLLHLTLPILAALACALALLLEPLCVVGLFLVTFIGLTQLAYIVPAVRRARRRGRSGLAKGLIIAAALTAILNTACWGAFLILVTHG